MTVPEQNTPEKPAVPHWSTGSKEEWRAYYEAQGYTQAQKDGLLFRHAGNSTGGDTNSIPGLIMAGANVDYFNGSSTPLIEAMLWCNYKAADMLMDAGCNLNAASAGDGFTAAMILVRNDYFSKPLFERFFDIGFDPMVTDTMGRNVLDHALAADNRAALQVLLDRAKASHLPELKGIVDPDENLFATLADMTEDTRRKIVEKKIGDAVKNSMLITAPIRKPVLRPKKPGM